MKANLSAIQTKILPVIFGFVLFAIAFSAVKGMVHGNVTNIKLLAGLVIIGGLVLALDKNYWLMLPFFYVASIKIPGVPFDCNELGILLVVAVYILRLVLQKEVTTRPPTPLLITFPLILWIFVVWCLNPTGFAFFGSSSIGARSYIRILLGVLISFVMCTKTIDEISAKRVFLAIILGQILQSIVEFFLIAPAGDDIGIDRNARYELLFGMFFYILMFSRYSLSECFSSLWKFFLVNIFVFCSMLSGKRRALAILVIIPLLRSFFTKKDRALTLGLVFVCLFVLVFAVAADGTFYELPNSVRRSFSTIVPKYRESEVSLDVFRYELREYGRDIIKKSPWVGRKGFAMDFRGLVWTLDYNANKNNVLWAVYTSNWHSTWYSYACDFGIPCAIFYAVALIYMLVYSKRLLSKTKYGSWIFVCVLYFTFQLYIDAIFSYTTGHSSHTTRNLLYNLSMLVALDNGLRQDKSLEIFNK